MRVIKKRSLLRPRATTLSGKMKVRALHLASTATLLHPSAFFFHPHFYVTVGNVNWREYYMYTDLVTHTLKDMPKTFYESLQLPASLDLSGPGTFFLCATFFKVWFLLFLIQFYPVSELFSILKFPRMVPDLCGLSRLFRRMFHGSTVQVLQLPNRVKI
jgi:hypothetical protein